MKIKATKKVIKILDEALIWVKLGLQICLLVMYLATSNPTYLIVCGIFMIELRLETMLIRLKNGNNED